MSVEESARTENEVLQLRHWKYRCRRARWTVHSHAPDGLVDPCGVGHGFLSLASLRIGDRNVARPNFADELSKRRLGGQGLFEHLPPGLRRAAGLARENEVISRPRQRNVEQPQVLGILAPRELGRRAGETRRARRILPVRERHPHREPVLTIEDDRRLTTAALRGQVRDEHSRPFQSFRLVNRQQLHCPAIGAVESIGLGFGRICVRQFKQLARECAAASLPGFVPAPGELEQLLDIGQRLLAERSAGDRHAVLRLLEQYPQQHADSKAVAFPPQAWIQTKESLAPPAFGFRQASGLEHVRILNAPKRQLSTAGGRNLEQRSVGNAGDRRSKHGGERQRVGWIRDQRQSRGEVEHLLRTVEAPSSYDPVRDAISHQRLPIRFDIREAAKQNGDVPALRFPQRAVGLSDDRFCLGRKKLPDSLCHCVRFEPATLLRRFRRVEYQPIDGWRAALGRANRLLVVVLGSVRNLVRARIETFAHQLQKGSIEKRDQVRRGPSVGAQIDAPTTFRLDLLRQNFEDRDIRTSKLVDGLFSIAYRAEQLWLQRNLPLRADRTHGSRRALPPLGKQEHDLQLKAIGVLELVDQQGADARLNLAPDVRLMAQKVARP